MSRDKELQGSSREVRVSLRGAQVELVTLLNESVTSVTTLFPPFASFGQETGLYGVMHTFK